MWEDVWGNNYEGGNKPDVMQLIIKWENDKVNVAKY
jgi:hypothetical protein